MTCLWTFRFSPELFTQPCTRTMKKNFYPLGGLQNINWNSLIFGRKCMKIYELVHSKRFSRSSFVIFKIILNLTNSTFPDKCSCIVSLRIGYTNSTLVEKTVNEACCSIHLWVCLNLKIVSQLLIYIDSLNCLGGCI